jgi:FxsC-like protein
MVFFRTSIKRGGQPITPQPLSHEVAQFMEYYFFLSYARANDNGYLKQFYKDLSQYIRDKEGLGKDAIVGFFDQKKLQLGDQWREGLVDALQSSRSMVCLYSPAYFNSEYCGKEWQAFKKRRASVSPLPPVIKPVIWIPPSTFPAAVGDLQYKIGSPQDAHNAQGLQEMRKFYSGYKKEYWKFIETLGNEIRQCWARNITPRLNNFPSLQEIQNPFSEPEQPPIEQKRSAKPSLAASKQVQFVFVAASPKDFVIPMLKEFQAADPKRFDQFRAAVLEEFAVTDQLLFDGLMAANPASFEQFVETEPESFEQFIDVALRKFADFKCSLPEQFSGNFRTQVGFYLKKGGWEWKPFWPQVKSPISNFVARVALEEDLDYPNAEMPFHSGLPKDIRDAETRGSLVILFVDSWTVELQDYREVLEKIDRESYKNCSIVVPWNNEDAETEQVQVRLKTGLRQTFSRWARLADLPKQIYFCDAIYSADDLRDKLREILKQLYTEVVASTLDDEKKPIPRSVESSIVKPTISL